MNHMTRRLLALAAFTIALSTIAVIAQQNPGDDDRRAAITVLRAINTAENAEKGKSGKYLPLRELLDQPMMGRVKAGFDVTGNTFKYAGAEIRVALSADAAQYVATIVAPSYTAAFTDERGVIFTGKALE